MQRARSGAATIASIAWISLVPATSSAQIVTSPKGFEKVAGDAASQLGIHAWTSGLVTRQSIVLDSSLKGIPRFFRTIWLRRSMVARDNVDAIGRKMDVTLRIADGDLTKVTGWPNQPLSQLVVGSWRTGMATRRVVFPDMRKRPAQGPAPWSLKLPLDQPYIYSGKFSLFVQLNNFGNTKTAAYPVDAQNGIAWATGRPIGTGCYLGAGKFTMHSQIVVDRAPSSLFYVTAFPDTGSLTFASLGITNPDLWVSSFCGKMLSSAEVVVPLQAAPNRREAAIRVPYSNSLVGVRFFTQAWAIDPKHTWRRFVFSNGERSAPFPARRGPPTSYAGAELYVPRGTASFANSATIWYGISTILGLER